MEDDELVYGVDKEEDDIEGMGQEGEEGEEVEGELADDMPDEFGGEFNMEEGAEDFKE